MLCSGAPSKVVMASVGTNHIDDGLSHRVIIPVHKCSTKDTMLTVSVIGLFYDLCDMAILSP